MANIQDRQFTACTFNAYYEGYPAAGNVLHSNRRYCELAHFILRQGWSLIAVQELSGSAYNKFKEILCDNQGPYAGFYKSHQGRPEGIGFFVRSDVFDINCEFPIDIQGGDNKSALRLELLHKATGKTVQAATSHFKGGPSPRRQIGDEECRKVAEELAQAQNEDGSTPDLCLLLADYNEDQMNPAEPGRFNRIDEIKRRYAYLEETDGAYPTEQVRELQGRLLGRRIDTICYRVKDGLIDPLDVGQEISVETINPQQVIEVYNRQLSDHLPYAQRFTFWNVDDESEPAADRAAHRTEEISAPPPFYREGPTPNQNCQALSQNSPMAAQTGLMAFLNSIYGAFVSFFKTLLQFCGFTPKTVQDSVP